MDYAYALLRGIVAAAAATGIAGCATPNLQPFGEQTARLADAISGEQRQITLKFERVIDLYGEACKQALRRFQGAGQPEDCKTRDDRDAKRKMFENSREAIDGLLEKAVGYATTLVDLANAGESGAQAAKSLGDTLGKFSSLAGLGGELVGGALRTVLEDVAKQVTRVQAQNSLSEATAAADPAITSIANGIVQIRVLEETVVRALYQDETAVARTLAGDELIGLFRDALASREKVNQRLRSDAGRLAELNDCGTAPPDERKELCNKLQGNLRNVEDLSRLLDLMRPEYEAYNAKHDAAVRWRAERRENLQSIAKAAAAWKSEHARVADQLRRCGGLRAVRCAELDAVSLKVLVNQINEIRSLKEK